MNYGELQTATFGDSFDPAKYRVRVKRWLNDAQRRLLRRLDLSTEERTADLPVASSASTATAPADLERLSSVVYLPPTGDGINLTPVPPSSLDEWDSQRPGEKGQPRMFAFTGTPSTLVFRPVADEAGVLRIRYDALPARMSADTDTPVIHEDYHELLVTWARAKCYRDEDDVQMHDSLMVDFENELSRMRVDLQSTVDDGPVQADGFW